MQKWAHKDEWKRFGTNFLISVSRHTEKRSGLPAEYFTDGPNRWCLYVYIYPKHPKFGTFDSDSMWQDATQSMPLHGGCTYLRYHAEPNGSINSIQVGCDYNHYRDEQYSFMETQEDARSVFADAEELFNYMEDYAK